MKAQHTPFTNWHSGWPFVILLLLRCFAVGQPGSTWTFHHTHATMSLRPPRKTVECERGIPVRQATTESVYSPIIIVRRSRGPISLIYLLNLLSMGSSLRVAHVRWNSTGGCREQRRLGCYPNVLLHDIFQSRVASGISLRSHAYNATL